MRPAYDKARGKIGDAFVDSVAGQLAEQYGITVLGVAGKDISRYSAADLILSVWGKTIRLQFEKRQFILEGFDTIHLPQESLEFDLLVEESLSGHIFVTHWYNVQIAPLIDVPNKYNKSGELFYNIPIDQFYCFHSIKVFAAWLREEVER